MNINKKRVVVGLSGGVDSSVAAYLLKEQGYEVIGMFMRNWHDTTGTLAGDCPWNDDRMFAELVAKKLDIEFNYIDLSDEYRKRVVDYMFSEYEKGRTPNPDVLCNREIKFDAFLKAALKLGADYVATGHYCQKDSVIIDGKEHYRLIAGADNNKDQSYFLCQLSQEQLEKALFPIGHIEKPEVRRIAMEQGLATAERKDSQGICFVGKVDLPVFLQQKLKPKKGNIIEIPKDWKGYEDIVEESNLKELSKPYTYSETDGIKVGEHNGAHYYTIGQRKGLNVGGKAEPLFVIGINVETNTVYVGQGSEHKGLFRKALFIRDEEVHWVREDLKQQLESEQRYKLRIRYRQPLQEGVLIIKEEGAYMVFDEPQRGVTAGQFAVWYNTDGELVGSGVINE
ncbi:MAG: tRNA 2-thiouridine(34) synthase MnmA [Rikenellaceae bacterium]